MSFVGKKDIKVKFPVGHKVHIDGDREIAAVVIGIFISGTGHLYEVSWFNEGVAETEKFDEFRLEKAQ